MSEPSIIIASLNDEQLKKSIQTMVDNFNTKLDKMVSSADAKVKEINEKLRGIKYDVGGSTSVSADGGASKRTQKLKEEEEQTKKTTAATKELRQAKKELTLDQGQAAIQTAISPKSARDSFYAFQQGFKEQARQLESLIKSEENRLSSLGLGRFSQETRNQLAQLDVSIDQTKWKMNLLYQEEKRLNQEALRQKVGSSAFEQAWLKKDETKSARVREGERLIELEKERQRIIASDPSVQTLDRNIEQTRAKIQQLIADEKRLHSEALKQTVGSADFANLWNQKYTVRDQRIAEEEKLIQLEKERQALVSVDPIRTQLTNVDELRAKHEKILGVMRDETTTNNRVAQSQEQVTSATQQTTQSAQRYTEEIRKQAAAIRATKEWQEKGIVVVGDTVFYDKERSNASKRDKQMLLSLEEQILQVQKNEAEAARKAAQETLTQEQAQKQVQEAAMNTARILETMSHYQTNVNKMQVDSTKIMSGKYGVGMNSFSQFDDLQIAISRVIGVEHQQIKVVDESYDSYNRLSASLSQLKAAYNSLNEEERRSDNGKILVQRMQVIERSMQKIQSQAARPISLSSVIGLSEKTLDDIAYKMRQLASYRSGLNVETQINEINQVNKKYAELQKNMNDIMRKNTDMIASNTALGRSWNYMKNRLAFYLSVGASTQFVKNLINIRGQYELLERSIGILFDSMQTGTRIFSELNAMAIKSPFTTMELGSAAKQLSAYNIKAKDVVDTTRRLADIAAAVGIRIERLTYALGQIKSYGYLNSRDARMFANAGIPLIQNLADMYTKLEGRLVSIGDVYDRIKKKQISFEDTLKVINEMTDEGGRFFNFQEKAADTLVVRLANLNLAWNNMLNNIGKSNQGILTSGLGVLKELFENWRKIDNLIWSIVTVLGVVKTAQLLILLSAKGITREMALQVFLGRRLGSMIYRIARSLKMLAVNPMTWIYAAVLALTYMGWKLWDLSKANENLNKSIVDSTKENIASIDKFFDKYRKDIESVGSMNTTDQGKMWERIRDEIEKTSKNAQQYIDILEKIPDVDKRVAKASGFLEQEKLIQEEINRLAQHGYFNVGGGFADESYASSLVAIDKYTSEMIRKYGTYEDYLKAFKDEFQGFYDEFRNAKFSWDIHEEIGESIEHFKKLENLNWGRILSGGTDEEKLARIRDAFITLRDNFFATEEMQNAGAEAQALYNMHMDYWITSIAKANNVIKDLTVNGQTFAAEDVAAVEERRTEWELFFSYLSEEERRTMDYLIKTNQTGGDEFKNIWDTAAESMRKSNTTAYLDLNNKIAELRETPDIVINIVYRELRDKLDKQQQEFEDRWIKPEKWGSRNLSVEQYLQEETANRTKYGRLMRKQDEDNVEWEKRLGQEYQDNAKKISSLNAQLKGNSKLKEADRQQKEKELKLYTDLNKVIKDIGDAENFNYDQFKKGGKGGSKKDPLLDVLKQTIDIIKKTQSEYDTLTQKGESSGEALQKVYGRYSKTLTFINAQLRGFGLPEIDLSKLIKGKNPNDVVVFFKNLLNVLTEKGLSNLERVKAVEVVIQEFGLKADTYNLDKITKGLNNELGKLKEEYELAVAFDADPELGNVFADMMGINMDALPHTVKEYADRYTTYLNKYLKGKESNLQFKKGELFGLTRDDITAFQEQVNAGTFNQEWFDEIKKAFDAISGMRKKDLEDTTKWKNGLIEKYGGLQAKLTKIYKDSIQQQVNAVKAFGTDEQESNIIRLQMRLEATENPAELSKINQEIAAIVKDVTDKNPIALKLIQASDKETESKSAKAYWEDFKDSDLYTMTFEDMANNSTAAIRTIIDRLNELKDKVKEDPASMKALMKSLEDAEKELGARNPLKAFFDSLGNIEKATKKVETARRELATADNTLKDAENALNAALKSGDPTNITTATEAYNSALDNQREKQKNVTKQESALKKEQSKLQTSLSDTKEKINAISSAFSAVSDVFREFGDEDTADTIDTINEGFAAMETVIAAVIAAMIALNTVAPELLVIAAAMGLIIGLIKLISSSSNNKITKQVEESERAVKRLQVAYVDLEHAIDSAYGMATIGAKKVAIANKELQLAELKRQLQLEKSRSSKNRDEDKIIDLQKQIKELEYDIKDSTDAIVNDLLGISSVGDAMGTLMDGFIEALRNGEDAMAVFDESVDDMIANMVKKMFATKILQPWFEKQWKTIQDEIDARAGEIPERLAKIQSKVSIAKMVDMNDNNSLVDALRALGMSDNDIDRLNWYTEDGERDKDGRNERLRKAYKELLKKTEEEERKTQDELSAATTATVDDMRRYAEMLRSGKITIGEWMDYLNGVITDLDLMKDGATDKTLSALQQGIQGITEDTAGSIEAYLNGVSQQVYLHSDLLTQIRDAVVGFDLDVQMATMGQILLQLQANYTVMMSMHSFMENWTVPSGNGIRVELIS